METAQTHMIDGITLATAVIAAFTVVLCLLQWWQISHNKEVARATYKLALFDKRMEVYLQIAKFINAFMQEGAPKVDAAIMLRWKTRTAHFLFPKEALSLVDEMVDKSFEHSKAYRSWEPLRARAAAGEPLTQEEDEKKRALLDEMHALEDWFFKQIEDGSLEKKIGPYLNLPETV